MSETHLIWSASLVVSAVIILPYLVAFRRRARDDRHRHDEATRLGIDRPPAQFPFVDPMLCIGCRTCIAACPEGDVLGIVGGTAVVINGLRCVGHGRCQEVCPVGAIEVGLGDLKERQDIPRLDEHLESDVPGLFIAGELGGLALIRNAVGQGRRAVERITVLAQGDDLPLPWDTLDLVIVGAGPAGLSAALAAAEHGLRYLVIEQEPHLGGAMLHYPRRKLVLTRPLELPLGGRLEDEEYRKEELLAFFEAEIRRHSVALRFGTRVDSVRREGPIFIVEGGGEALRARRVLLALGRRGTPRKLGVPGEELSHVMYQLRDAEAYAGRRVLCIGGGDSAVEAAVGLAHQPGCEVTISYRKDRFYRIKRKNLERVEELVARRSLRAVMSSTVRAIEPDRTHLEVGGAALEVPADHVFVFAGGEPPFPFLRRTGVRFGNEPERVGCSVDQSGPRQLEATP